MFLKLKEHPDKFRQYTRFTIEEWAHLMQLVHTKLERNSRREAISPEQRLVLTMRFLASGASFRQLSFDFLIGETTVGKICRDTCQAIVEALAPTYMRKPAAADEWRKVAADFWERWNVPNCLGAIDGKHIRMKAPPNSGSQFHNYKGYFSTVLMAVADANYRVIYASVGSFGRESDGGVFSRCNFGQMVIDADNANPLQLPPAEPLPGTDDPFPYFFLGDAAFPLRTNLMKPYPETAMTDAKRVYNYRICRARRLIESTFGLMAQRFRLLLRPIETTAENCDVLVQAIVCLHNFLVDEGDVFFTAGEGEDQEPHLAQAANIVNNHANRSADQAMQLRNKLKDFFNGVGAVEWQNDYI